MSIGFTPEVNQLMAFFGFQAVGLYNPVPFGLVVVRQREACASDKADPPGSNPSLISSITCGESSRIMARRRLTKLLCLSSRLATSVWFKPSFSTNSRIKSPSSIMVKPLFLLSKYIWAFWITSSHCTVITSRLLRLHSLLQYVCPFFPWNLTKEKLSMIIPTAGKTEAGSSGEQLARDSRSGCDEYSARGVKKLPALSPLPGGFFMNIWSFPNASKNSRRCRGVLNL